MNQESLSKRTYRKGRTWLASLGPGVITGASDDDPSGIATYSQAGAQFGFGLLWTTIVSFPMMVAIQVASAEIGRVTGSRIACNMKKYYSNWITFSLIFLVLAANIFIIGADIAAMGEASTLILGGHAVLYSVILTIIGILLQVFIPYSKYVFF